MSGELLKSISELNNLFKTDKDNIIDNQKGESYVTYNELYSIMDKITDTLNIMVNDEIRPKVKHEIEEIKHKKVVTPKKIVKNITVGKNMEYKTEISVLQNRYFIGHIHNNIAMRCEPTMFASFIYYFVLPIFNPKLYMKTKDYANDVISYIEKLYSSYGNTMCTGKIKNDITTIGGVEVASCLYDDKIITEYRNKFKKDSENGKTIPFEEIINNEKFEEMKKQLPTLEYSIITEDIKNTIKEEYVPDVHKYISKEYFN